MSYEPEGYEPVDAVARNKTSVPGILLIIVGILNLLFALYMLVQGVIWAMTPVEQIQAAQQQAQEVLNKMFPNLPVQQGTPEQTKMQEMVVNLAWGAVAGLAALVTLFGGIKMRHLQSYGLAVFGSILAIIPCLSFSGCCILGEVAGIWALVVLMSQDVRSAFQ